MTGPVAAPEGARCLAIRFLSPETYALQTSRLSALMAKPRHLARAPITEAVLDIQVAPRAGATFADLESAYGSLDFGYRRQSFVITSTMGFVVGQDAEVQQKSGTTEKVGLRLHSADEKYIALVRTNGLSVSRLTPYEDFGRLEAETRRLWEIYVKRWAPDRVTRVAARFINNLRLKFAPKQKISDFIVALSEVPPELPQAVSSFVQQFDCGDEGGSDCRARVSFAWNGTIEEGDRYPMVLDIDAYRAGQTLSPTDPLVWTTFDQLRQLKNRCFFGSLTDLAVKEYE
jgi:uncharacterized protein (TIGR04255 family)